MSILAMTQIVQINGAVKSVTLIQLKSLFCESSEIYMLIYACV
jgi:hypothetical protein